MRCRLLYIYTQQHYKCAYLQISRFTRLSYIVAINNISLYYLVALLNLYYINASNSIFSLASVKKGVSGGVLILTSRVIIELDNSIRSIKSERYLEW